jgi:transposase
LRETLGEREREVVKLIAEGESSKTIAARLGISPATVEAKPQRDEEARHPQRGGADPLRGPQRAYERLGGVFPTACICTRARPAS